jgi:DNA-binding beta-propeller fold protein YncE
VTLWSLLSETARLLWLRACCAVAEGADVPLSHTTSDSSPRCPPDVCVAAVLGDALHRVTVLGGRDGMPRSLGSVYGGSVTLCLGGSLRVVVSRVVDTPGVQSESNGVAVSRDGSTLLVSDSDGLTDAVYEFSTADGSRRRVIGGEGTGPLQFKAPAQVFIAADGFVFVADCYNHRVQVLTPTLDLHSTMGAGQLRYPAGVCANADIVAVSGNAADCITVFDRRDGFFLREEKMME